MIYSKVKGQHIDVCADPIYSDSVNFLSLKLDLSKEWNGYQVTAVFKGIEGNVVSAIFNEDSGFYIGDNSYLVPYEVIKVPSFTFSLIGTKDDSRITTNAVEVTVKESGYAQGDAPGEPTPSEYEQIVSLYQSVLEIAQSVRLDADNGAFKGEKGDKGDDGLNGIDGKDGINGIDGKDGINGIDGKDGEDYILTEADKTEIANMVLDIMPDGDEVNY